MVNEAEIPRTLQKKAKLGKKYNVIFSKTADETRIDVARLDQNEAKRKREFEERLRNEAAVKKTKSEADNKRRASVEARKQVRD
jgi:hypothetical protein